MLLSSCFSNVCHPQVSFLGECHLQVVFTACVAFQLAVSGMCRFHSSFMVISYFALHLVLWPLALTGFFHGVFRLQVSVFLALYAFRLIFITCNPLIFLNCFFHASLLGFRSMCLFQSSFLASFGLI